jgi:hypothetical protein
MRRRSVPVVSVFTAAMALTCTGCPSTPTLQNHPAFQLTYLDRNSAVRVRYSDDGVTWADGNISALDNAGVGASSSPDVAGVTRLVAHGNGAASLRLHFGLGPETWDANPVALPNLSPASRPTIVDIGGSRYLIAFLPPNSRAFELWLYDHAARTTTQIPVSAGRGNDSLRYAPAMAFLPRDRANPGDGGRVALAWARYAHPNSSEPTSIRTLYANITQQGTVAVGGGFFVIDTDSLDSFNYQGPIPHLLSPPVLAHDHTKFILATHERFYGIQPTTRLPHYLQMHTSPDGEVWRTTNFLQFTGTRSQDDASLLEFAVQPNCTAVLVIMPLGTATVHAQLHLPNGNDQTIPAADVFGNNLPMERAFTLITTGRPASFPSFGCTHF